MKKKLNRTPLNVDTISSISAHLPGEEDLAAARSPLPDLSLRGVLFLYGSDGELLYATPCAEAMVGARLMKYSQEQREMGSYVFWPCPGASEELAAAIAAAACLKWQPTQNQRLPVNRDFISKVSAQALLKSGTGLSGLDLREMVNSGEVPVASFQGQDYYYGEHLMTAIIPRITDHE